MKIVKAVLPKNLKYLSVKYIRINERKAKIFALKYQGE